MVFDQAILLHSGQLGTHGGTLYAEIIGQLLTIERHGECAAPLSARLCGEVGKQLVPRGAMIHVRRMYTPRQDGERVQTSNLSDKTAQIALEYQERRERINREWYEQMEKELQMVSDEVTFFEAAVHALPIKIRGAVSALFIGQDTWDTVQADFHIGRATLSAYRRQALRILEMLHAVYQSRAIYNPRQKAIYSEETGPNLTEMNEKWDHWGWSKYVKH